jgi:hypothetical protein
MRAEMVISSRWIARCRDIALHCLRGSPGHLRGHDGPQAADLGQLRSSSGQSGYEPLAGRCHIMPQARQTNHRNALFTLDCSRTDTARHRGHEGIQRPVVRLGPLRTTLNLRIGRSSVCECRPQQPVEIGLHLGDALELQVEFTPVRNREFVDFAQASFEIGPRRGPRPRPFSTAWRRLSVLTLFHPVRTVGGGAKNH